MLLRLLRLRQHPQPKKAGKAKKEMAVSIADMERVALGGGDDIGQVIELGDLNDDLGLSMLMNPNKVSVQQSPGPGRTVSVNSYAPPAPAPAPSVSFGGSGSGGGLGAIELTPLEPMEPIDMNDFGAPPIQVSVSKEGSGMPFQGAFGNSQSATGPGVVLSSPARDPEAEKKEKGEYITKLQRLEAKGFAVSRKFTMDNSLEEIKTEYFRLVDARQLETSIKFQRQMLMGAITGMEWLNGRFDPFDLKLDGWSESVHENAEDFDEIFEELYDKYKDKGKMSPEIRLMMAVGGSGFMCHVSNSFFRSKMPSMDDVLRKNPELARQMAAAAAQQAGPGFGNFMGMAMGMPPQGPQGPQGMPQGPPGSMGSPFSGNGGSAGPMGPMPPMPPSGAFFAASAAPPAAANEASTRPTARREMTGPTGPAVDDILKTFEEVRRAEMMAASLPQYTTGSPAAPTQAAVAQAQAQQAASVADDMSQGESVRTGATGQGRRRRRNQAPVGTVVGINV